MKDVNSIIKMIISNENIDSRFRKGVQNEHKRNEGIS
jgi:hypothetical protein